MLYLEQGVRSIWIECDSNAGRPYVRFFKKNSYYHTVQHVNAHWKHLPPVHWASCWPLHMLDNHALSDMRAVKLEIEESESSSKKE